ncbi:MAG: TonB family protein [Bryobacteraceae bacterium]
MGILQQRGRAIAAEIHEALADAPCRDTGSRRPAEGADWRECSGHQAHFPGDAGISGNRQRRGIEGTVLLRSIIATDGSLLSIGVTNTLADPDLAAAAADAVRPWWYQPTLLNGQPMLVITTISVNFHLQK